MSVSEIFVELQGFLAAEQDIREEIRKVVQSLEQTAREILTLLQGVHQGTGFQDIIFYDQFQRGARKPENISVR